MKALKNITLLLFALSTIFLTGCENDEDGTPSNNKMLIGTWDIVGVYRNGQDQTTTEDNYWAYNVVEHEWNHMEFEEGGYNIYIGNVSIHGANWRTSGNTLNLGNGHSARIIKLTDEELIVEMNWEDYSEEEKLYEFRLHRTN